MPLDGTPLTRPRRQCFAKVAVVTSQAGTQVPARSRVGGLVMVLAAAACFGVLAIIVKIALRAGGQGLPMLAVRYVMAAAILWVVLGVFDRSALAVGRRNIVRIVAMALVGYGFASVCFFVALTRIQASLMEIILFTYPTLVAVASVRMFGEPLTKDRLASLILTFAGVGLTVWAPGVRIDWLGVLIACGAPIGYAGFSLLSYRWRAHFKPEAITAYGLPVAAVPIMLLAGPAAAFKGILSWTPEIWLLVLAMALFPTIAAIGLYVRGVARLGAPAAALAATFEPVVTLVLAAMLLSERLSPTQWVGAALVLAGVAVAEAAPAVRAARAAAEV